MNKILTRTIINILLLVMALLLMGYEVVGGLAHELLSLAFILVLVVHLYLNRNWFKLGKKNIKMSSKKIWNIILIVATVLTFVSGFGVSEYLLPMNNEIALFKGLHTLSSNLFLVGIIAHVILYRKHMISYFKKLFSAKPND